MSLLPQPWEAYFMTFFFVYFRVSVALFVMPILSNNTVTGSIRAGLAFWIAIVLIGPLWGLHQVESGWIVPNVDRVFNGFLEFGIALIGEASIGFILGFIGQMIIQTIAISGEIIGKQAGFSAASVFDPITGQDLFLMAQVNTLLGTMIFFAVGGPEHIIEYLAASFQLLKPGEGVSLMNYREMVSNVLLFDSVHNGDRMHALGTMMYKVGLQIAAPIMVTMFLVSLAEAFIAKVSPQLNILAVGFAIRIGISLVVLFNSMGTSMLRFKYHVLSYKMYAEAALSWLAPMP
ncbi:MAG: flagellar biosynthetic protein FliR [Candidatus Hinthialibacter antarcticus]|nr:flagellar biosynthetic protein FliR [Candidatus Hinthialibacter antarcticus]